jgi:multidrug efflux pump subunit AcrA (membrane-fusion protein)
MQRSIFRKVALERLSSPEQLDQLMQVTDRRGWLALTALVGLLATAVTWGVLGSVSTRVMGQGILIRSGGLNSVVSTYSGEVTELHVRVGDVIERGQVLASLFQSNQGGVNQLRYVSSPHHGRVVETMLDEGDFIREGTRLLNLEPLDRRLEAIVYVPLADGKRVQPEMEVELAPATVKPEEWGFMVGMVREVSAFPVTQEGMTRLLGAADLARQFSMGGQPYEIVVDLLPDPGSFSGYRWSSAGPSISIESGTTCSAKIVVERRRPISLVIPLVRRTLGVY